MSARVARGLVLLAVLTWAGGARAGGARAATITEFSQGLRPGGVDGSGPWGIAFGPDANLWFTEINGNRVARITATGAVTEFP